MPPKIRFTRENVLNAAFEMVKECGIEALNARSLAARAGSSTQPLFRMFSGMDEIREAVVEMAMELFDEYVRAALNSDMPVYKRTGMAYMRFAREQRQLFRLLFMRERTDYALDGIMPQTMDYVYGAGMDSTGFDAEEIKRFHLHMWIYVHGLATMVATGYLDVGDELASALITECYQGFKKRFEGEK